MSKKTYLGDGLYAYDDGFQFWLETDRNGELHYVALDSEVIDSFLRFIERSRKLKILVTRETENS